METKELEDFLVKKHCSFFLDDSDPDVRDKEASGTITTNSIGSWLWVSARISGSFMEKWYSRASSERTNYYYVFSHDWVGLSKNAPSKITRQEELESWAQLSTTYKYSKHNPKYVDDSSYLECSGRRVDDISDDGKVTIMVSSTMTKPSEGGRTTMKCVDELEYFQL